LQELAVLRDLVLDDIGEGPGEAAELVQVAGPGRAEGDDAGVLGKVEEVLLEVEAELLERQCPRGQLADEGMRVERGPDRLGARAEVRAQGAGGRRRLHAHVRAKASSAKASIVSARREPRGKTLT